jgi:uncharacterized membrane protein YkvI
VPSRIVRLLVPGLVVQAVLVGGGYATGRELVEFFLTSGPATALMGMALTAVFFSLGSMLAFELARLYAAFDYRSFCRIYLGRAWVLFEWGYFAILLLVLSVVASAAGQLLGEMAGFQALSASILFMACVAFLVFFGNAFVERIISIWSVIFYIAYGSMLALVIHQFGATLPAAVHAVPLRPSAALSDGISYTGYNIAILPVLIYIARNFESRRQALTAGALAGPLILLPGFAFLLALTAFYPSINAAALPVTVVLDGLHSVPLRWAVQLVILGAFVKTGVGLLHGLNERVARSAVERHTVMPRGLRSGIALAFMVLAVFLGSTFGIIDLIARGYRFSSYYFLAVFVVPLMTRGFWLVVHHKQESPAVVAGGASSTAQ